MQKIDGMFYPEGKEGQGTRREIETIDLALSLVKNKNIFVDVGAGVGLWSIRLHDVFGAIHAFEPDAENHQCAQENLKTFWNVRLYNMALSNVAGRGAIKQNEEKPLNFGAKFLVDGDAVFKTTMDAINLQDVSLIKIDVEGHEYRVLKGAEQTIIKFKPVIVFEDKHADVYNDVGKASEFLEQLGYSLKGSVRCNKIYSREI